MQITTQITTTYTIDRIEIRGPYSEENNKRFRSIGGKFSRDLGWQLPQSPASEDLISELFGKESETVVIEVPMNAGFPTYKQTLQMEGYVLASRRGRDTSVSLAPGVKVFSGSFTSRGGSAKSPAVTWNEGTILHVAVRREFAESHEFAIVPDDHPKPVEASDNIKTTLSAIEGIMVSANLSPADKINAIRAAIL
jgi:hypothetical protein